MDTRIIAITYIKCLLVASVAIYCLVFIFSKKSVINVRRIPKSKKESIQKNSKKVDFIFRVVMAIYIIISIPLLIVPALLDIPNVVQGKYETIQCRTISHDNVRDIVKQRNIFVVDVKTNKSIELKVNYGPIQEGEYFTINYLPHLRIGEIVQ